MQKPAKFPLRSYLPPYLRDFLLFFLPLTLLIGAAVLALDTYRQAQLNEQELNYETFSVKFASHHLARLSERPTDHLFSLNQLEREWLPTRSGQPPNLSLLVSKMTTLLERNPNYDQVRWIRDDGHEGVRINQHQPHLVQVVPNKDLQDKHDRYYVTDTLLLDPGQIYVSALDLNMENGHIEEPWKPTIRFAQHVFDRQQHSMGILLINMRTQNVLDEIAQEQRSGSQLMLLNEEGYWLHHPNPKKCWGFMFPAGKMNTLAEENPEMWGRISTNDRGAYVDEQGLWSWSRVTPSASNGKLHAPTWYVLSFRPNTVLAGARHNIRNELWVLGGMLLALLGLAAWAVARSNFNRNQKQVLEQQSEWLTNTNQRLNQSLESRTRELRAAAEEMLQRQRFVVSMSDNLPIMVSYWDNDLHCRFANAQFRTWAHLSQEQIDNMSMREVLGSPHFERQKHHLQAVLEGEIREFNDSHLKPNGQEIHTLTQYVPDLQQSNVCGFFMLTSDITQLKQVQVELARHAREADSANRAKSEFLSIMSHEIRTPLNGVLGLTFLLERMSLPPEAKSLLNRLSSAGQTLLALINDILDFSKIEVREMKLEQVPFRLDEMLDSIANILSMSIGNKPIEPLILPVPHGANYLTGDATRLRQVLLNLVGNAAKFTERGHVSVRVSRLDSGESLNKVHLRFEVSDSGIGIPVAKQGHIFAAFSQADTSTTRHYGGTGLGLTICARLVELMGGKLTVESQVGIGSTFRFDLFFELSNPLDTALPDMSHQHLLIVDDQELARQVAASAANSLGWSADTVASGAETLKKLQDPRARPYDLIVLDWRMPGLDGLETAQMIRELEIHHNLTILMATAYDCNDLQIHPDRKLVDGVLAKPVTPSVLFDAVMLAKKRGGQLQTTPTPLDDDKPLQGLTILVVDDSDLNRDVAGNILAHAGAGVIYAEQGQQALDWLSKPGNRCDAVLMDIQMPVMDGYETTQRLRKLPGLDKLPVIALTAGAFSEQREQALSAGMDDFVAKPFNPQQLLLCLLQQVGRKQPDGAHDLPQRDDGDGPQSLLLNSEYGLKIWQNNVEQYERYLRRFAESYGDFAEQLTAHPAQAASLIHKLHGAAAQLGLDALALSARHCEPALRRHEPLEDLQTTLLSLLERTLHAITDYVQNCIPPSGNTRSLPPRTELQTLMRHAVEELLLGNPEAAELMLEKLTDTGLSLQPLQEALEHFDFRLTISRIRHLATELQLSLEN